ncbi:hypothetical protein scyTo_0006542 [Scyliorhinus torazame]|uniref:Uncharacterized protein n=1 Tax=Scyliorhinus torazame TaxID=75743 RepID=A0A401PII0_SCYTO|nr:hypothetical protein [Scyliorhinus torazame]
MREGVQVASLVATERNGGKTICQELDDLGPPQLQISKVHSSAVKVHGTRTNSEYIDLYAFSFAVNYLYGAPHNSKQPILIQKAERDLGIPAVSVAKLRKKVQRDTWEGHTYTNHRQVAREAVKVVKEVEESFGFRKAGRRAKSSEITGRTSAGILCPILGRAFQWERQHDLPEWK